MPTTTTNTNTATATATGGRGGEAVTADDIVLRPATLSDCAAMARIAVRAYSNTPFSTFQFPLQAQYLDDHIQYWHQRVRQRILETENESVVAVLSDACANPGKIVGFSQFKRLGNDSRARARRAARDTYTLTIQRWVYWALDAVYDAMFPSRAVDKEARRTFIAAEKEVKEKVWGIEMLSNLWWGQSVIVDPDWQGRRIGPKMMAVFMEAAQEDGVPIGLEASTDGKRLYDKLGFKLVGPSPLDLAAGAGQMMWTPEGFPEVRWL